MGATDERKDTTGEMVGELTQRFGLSEREAMLLHAMDVMMRRHAEETRVQIKGEIQTLEERIKPLFDGLLTEHIKNIEMQIDDFIVRYQQKNPSPLAMQKSIQNLTELVKSQNAAQTRELSSQDMQKIYDRVTKPLHDLLHEGFTDTNKHLIGVNKNLTNINNENSEALYARMVEFKNEILNSQQKSEQKISGMMSNRLA